MIHTNTINRDNFDIKGQLNHLETLMDVDGPSPYCMVSNNMQRLENKGLIRINRVDKTDVITKAGKIYFENNSK